MRALSDPGVGGDDHRRTASARGAVDISVMVAGVAAAALLAATILFTTDLAASEPKNDGAACTCPETNQPDKPWPRPRYADLKATLDETDEIATLEALHLALSEVGDGASYVWHRRDGRLSGLIKPTASFKDDAGRLCRHVVIHLAAGSYNRKTEGIACRLGNGQWQLDG